MCWMLVINLALQLGILNLCVELDSAINIGKSKLFTWKSLFLTKMLINQEFYKINVGAPRKQFVKMTKKWFPILMGD